MKTSGIFLLILLSLIISCSGYFFGPGDEELYSLEILSLSNGSTLQKGEPVFFSINTPENNEPPSHLDINLYSSDGEKIAGLSMDNDEIAADEPNLKLENLNLETGLYEIEFILYGPDTVLVERRLLFFYIEGVYAIQGVEASLPVIFPGAKVLLIANVEAPENSDPYIRWKQNQVVLANGSLKDGLDRIYWSAPEEEGIYSLTVELFPVLPPSDTDYDFISSTLMDMELYVSSSAKSDNDLAPQESYFSLLHLNGTLADTGMFIPNNEKGRIDAEEQGILEPVAREGNLGYRIANSSGFLIPRFILPVEDGRLQPFSLSLGLILESLNENARLIRIVSEVSGENDFSLELYLDEENGEFAPAALMNLHSLEIQIPSGISHLDTGKRYLLTLSLVPAVDAQSFELVWHLDGIEYKRLPFDIPLDGFSTDGTTRIGGEGGFNGILDELGVYYRNSEGEPSSDTNLFFSRMKQKYGVRLVYANGFDGGRFDPENHVTIEGEASVRSGKLELPASSELQIVTSGKTEAAVEIDLSKSGYFSINLEEQSLNITALPETEETGETLTDIYLKVTPQLITLSTPEGPITLTRQAESSEASSFVVRLISGKEVPLSLDSLLVYTE